MKFKIIFIFSFILTLSLFSTVSGQELSCLPGTDICCNGGWVIDYTESVCCPPNAPHLRSAGSGFGCLCFESDISDNFFTRNSECNIEKTGACTSPSIVSKEKKCIGNELQECTETENFIFEFENKGKVAGECGIECLSNSDCGEGEECGWVEGSFNRCRVKRIPTDSEEEVFFDKLSQCNLFKSANPGLSCRDCLLSETNDGLKYISICNKEGIELPNEEPTPPSPNGFILLIQNIIDWIRGLFNSFFKLSITGSSIVEPNTLQTYNIELTTQVPDSIWNDGTYEVQYANWALISSNGEIKEEGTWERVNGSYNKEVIITTPSNLEDFVVIGVITQIDMTYNSTTLEWSSSEERIVNKEAIDVKTKLSVTEPEEPPPSGFTNLIDRILDWFRNFFSNLFS